MLPRDYNITPAIMNPDVKLTGVQYESSPGAAYGDHIKNTGAICNTSASHTYGNVLSVVEKYILDRFPHETFATITAGTSLRSRQLNHLPRQLRKKETPILVLSPRISFGQGDDRFLGGTLINSRYNDLNMLWGNGSLIQLAHSREKNIYVQGHYNRALMFVDVIMTFDTYAEQVNWMSFIHNMIPVEHPLEIRAPLELYLPTNFCKLLGELAGVPVQDKDGSVYDFTRMMNTMWEYPITYKLKGGNNQNSFFMYYLTDIIATVQEPMAGPGIKDGQVKTNFDISFTVRVEFNTIGYFTITCPTIRKQITIDGDKEGAIQPIMSDQINLADYKLPIGWTILSWPIFKLDYGEDTISFESILNRSITSAIDHHLATGMPMDQFIRIEFREHGVILDNERFWIDWQNREIHLLNPDCHRTYRLIVTVSPEYINNLVKTLYGLE